MKRSGNKISSIDYFWLSSDTIAAILEVINNIFPISFFCLHHQRTCMHHIFFIPVSWDWFQNIDSNCTWKSYSFIIAQNIAKGLPSLLICFAVNFSCNIYLIYHCIFKFEFLDCVLRKGDLINPLRHVPAVTSRDECWPLFHF